MCGHEVSLLMCMSVSVTRFVGEKNDLGRSQIQKLFVKTEVFRLWSSWQEIKTNVGL